MTLILLTVSELVILAGCAYYSIHEPWDFIFWIGVAVVSAVWYAAVRLALHKRS